MKTDTHSVNVTLSQELLTKLLCLYTKTIMRQDAALIHLSQHTAFQRQFFTAMTNTVPHPLLPQTEDTSIVGVCAFSFGVTVSSAYRQMLLTRRRHTQMSTCCRKCLLTYLPSRLSGKKCGYDSDE